VYFMLTACGRPQGGEGWSAHVDRGVSKTRFFVGVKKWMAPMSINFEVHALALVSVIVQWLSSSQ